MFRPLLSEEASAVPFPAGRWLTVGTKAEQKQKVCPTASEQHSASPATSQPADAHTTSLHNVGPQFPHL